MCGNTNRRIRTGIDTTRDVTAAAPALKCAYSPYHTLVYQNTLYPVLCICGFLGTRIVLFDSSLGWRTSSTLAIRPIPETLY